MHRLCGGIVATHAVCAESSLDLVSGRPDLRDKIKAALGSQGTLSQDILSIGPVHPARLHPACSKSELKTCPGA